MDNLERRFLEVADVDELAVEPRANGQTSIVGYAAVYNRLSLDLAASARKSCLVHSTRFSTASVARLTLLLCSTTTTTSF